MNKITILTIGIAVLLMISALPANAIKEVSSFESAGPIVNATALYNDSNGLTGAGDTNRNFTANDLPMFFLDIDEVDFEPTTAGESLYINLTDEDEIGDDDLIYRSEAWLVDGRYNIAWLGEKYLAVGKDTEKLSKYLVDFESDEDITLRQGDVWDIGEGFTIVVQDIDINGEKAWFVLEQDGSPIADIIAEDGEWGYYNDTLAGESDVVIAKIHVDKVFAGMTANMAIIDDAEVISIDVLELDDTEYYGMDFDSGDDWLELTEDDTTSISRGKTVEIIPDFMSIRVGDTESTDPVRFYVYQEITEPGIYEQHGAIVNATDEFDNRDKNVKFTADELPMFYQDLDELDFNPANEGESLNITLLEEDEIGDTDDLIYRSEAWLVDGRYNIAWLGEKYLAVGKDTEKLSKYLVDFESDEDITLRQGDVWDIGEGFTLVVEDIDINGEKVWLNLEQDGSPIADIIAEDGEWGYYNDTLAGESDVVIAKIHVDKVFAGMTANMAIIDDAEVISIDVLELDDTEYYGMDFDSGDDWLELTEDDTTSISRGKTVEIIPDFMSIRVGDTESGDPVRFYIYNEVQVGEGVTPVTTAEPNETATVDINATVTPTDAEAEPTATADADAEAIEEPTEKPVPGFEAVFAIAGLLAVAYLVLRKRE